MKARVYVSGIKKGWTEVSLPQEFQHFSYEKLVNQIHTLISRKSYKGLLITQNPCPFQQEK